MRMCVGTCECARVQDDNIIVHVGVSGVIVGVTEKNEAHSQLTAISMHNFQAMLTMCMTIALPPQFTYVRMAC